MFIGGEQHGCEGLLSVTVAELNAKLNAELEAGLLMEDDDDDGYEYENGGYGAAGAGAGNNGGGYGGDGSNYDGYGALGGNGGAGGGTSVDDFSYSDDGSADSFGGGEDDFDDDDNDDDGNALDNGDGGGVNGNGNGRRSRGSGGGGETSIPIETLTIPAFHATATVQNVPLEHSLDASTSANITNNSEIISPPLSPNPHLGGNDNYHGSSFVSLESSCRRSQHSSTESLNSLSYSQHSMYLPITPNTPYDGPMSPYCDNGLLPSSGFNENAYNLPQTPFKGDSFFEDERMFVQEIHNSGLQSNSFEHVEDMPFPSEEVDLLELDYDVGEDGVEVGIGGKTNERREMERRMIQIYRQIRALGRKKKQHKKGVGVGVEAGNVNGGDEKDEKEECDDEGMEMAPLTGDININGSSSPIPRTNSQHGSANGNSFRETKCHPGSINHGWNPRIYLRMQWWNFLWWWNLRPLPHSAQQLQRAQIELQSKPKFPSCSVDGVDIEEGDESTRLTSSCDASSQSVSHTNSLFSFTKHKRKVKHSNIDEFDYTYNGYDDVDFDRSSNSLCYQLLCFICNGRGGGGGGRHPNGKCSYYFWYIHSGWKKLFIVSAMFLLSAWMFTGGGLTKHHYGEENNQYPYVYGAMNYGSSDKITNFNDYFSSGYDDALGKDNFAKEDDYDGYFQHHPMVSPEDDDVDLIHANYPFSKKKQEKEQNDDVYNRFEMQDDMFTLKSTELDDIVPTDDFFVIYQPLGTASVLPGIDGGGGRLYNSLVGIDTIVVLGERHVGMEWLIEKLKLLYPDIDVMNGFPTAGKAGRDGWWFQDNGGIIRRRVQQGALLSEQQSQKQPMLPLKVTHFSFPPPPKQSYKQHRSTKVVDPSSGKIIHHLADEDDEFAESILDSAHILVIALFVNPYDWVELMRVDPIYAPNHKGMKWKEFVEEEWSPFGAVSVGNDGNSGIESWEDDDDTKPTIIDKIAGDGVIPLDASKNTDAIENDDDDNGHWDDYLSNENSPGEENQDLHHTRTLWRLLYTFMGFGASDEENSLHDDSASCQLSFDMTRVLPCWNTFDGKSPPPSALKDKPRKNNPVYEMRIDGSGHTYNSILGLRADKIRSAVKDSMKHPEVGAVIPVQYEELVNGYSDGSFSNFPGIVGLMNQIQARTGLLPDETAGWKEQSKTDNPFWADPIGCNGRVCVPSINKMRNDAEYIKYMNENVDWDAEKLIGYQKRSLPKPMVEQIVVLGERHSGAEWLVDRLALCFPNVEVSPMCLQNSLCNFIFKQNLN